MPRAQEEEKKTVLFAIASMSGALVYAMAQLSLASFAQ